MAQWNSSDSGILRKSKKKDNFEDLLVFGYACKIFRDDDKALHIDQGKHLIPWMGDDNLKIDRYDCRGHLSDLTQYEASREGYLGLDENERRLEQLCDKERYYSLHINEEEEELYKEEEQKRNQTNEYQYSYDVPMKPIAPENIPGVPENDEDEKYVPSVELDVPIDIAIPKTTKENARIEKTAMFVSTQGPQMEILIKAKQADNPQFSFLNQNDPLYKFYRHVLNAIKTGRYKINSAKTDQNTSNVPGGDTADHYLHPSLLSSATSNTEVLLPTIPSVPYRPSANCAYSQLVNRIQGTSGVTGAATPPPLPGVVNVDQSGVNAGQGQGQINIANLTYEQQQQYYQYYIQQQYYEYYKHLMQNSGSDEMPSHSDMSMDPNVQAYVQQMMYTHYLQQSQNQQAPTNSYAQIVSNVSKDIPNLFPPSDKPDISKEPVIYEAGQESSSTAAIAQDTAADVGKNTEKKVPTNDTSPKKASLLSLIQNYGSDSEEQSSDEEEGENEEEEEEKYKIPDGETKVVIDKMASYVVKNGADFESIVKSRADPRFEFLNDHHEYHKYYRFQVSEEYRKKREMEGGGKADMDTKEIVKSHSNKVKEKKIIAPVCFSIKKSKEDVPKEIKSALPVDEETDDEIEEENEQEAAPLPPMISQPQTLVSSNTAKKIYHLNSTSTAIKCKEKDPKHAVKHHKDQNGKEIKDSIKETKENKETNIVKSDASKTEKDIKCASEEKAELDVAALKKVVNRFKNNGSLEEDDPILEMIDLTNDTLDETKRNDEKDVDIFDIESDKEQIPKENRALQLERRRKAMAFLKMKSVTSSVAHAMDSATTTIPTIDLSNIKSPRRKTSLSESSEEEERGKVKRERSNTRDRDLSEEPKLKRTKESEKSISRKEREKDRKSRSPRGDKRYEYVDLRELEEGEMVDNKDESKYRKSSHKKKKSHKSKHSKSKHSSKSKKKSKKKGVRVASPSSDDSDRSSQS